MLVELIPTIYILSVNFFEQQIKEGCGVGMKLMDEGKNSKSWRSKGRKSAFAVSGLAWVGMKVMDEGN